MILSEKRLEIWERVLQTWKCHLTFGNAPCTSSCTLGAICTFGNASRLGNLAHTLRNASRDLGTLSECIILSHRRVSRFGNAFHASCTSGNHSRLFKTRSRDLGTRLAHLEMPFAHLGTRLEIWDCRNASRLVSRFGNASCRLGNLICTFGNASFTGTCSRSARRAAQSGSPGTAQKCDERP